jgi:hypothetical protein
VSSDYEAVRAYLSEPVAPGSNFGPTDPMEGLYLKPHGSLNWFTCPNLACPKSRTFVILDIGQCLAVSSWGIDFQCNYCHGELSALLVAPLAQKPVMNNSHLRNIWGNALAVLANAAKIVVIGFSFQPSDFYAAWLFRHALQYQKDAEVLVVNPANADPTFQSRMQNIFGHRYNPKWTSFTQIDQIIRQLEYPNIRYSP